MLMSIICIENFLDCQYNIVKCGILLLNVFLNQELKLILFLIFGEIMNMREKREFRKVDFEIKCYKLDANINQILQDLENCNDVKIIKKHFEQVQYLVETYRELMLSGIELDISYNQKDMEILAGRLFDRYCELI